MIESAGEVGVFPLPVDHGVNVAPLHPQFGGGLVDEFRFDRIEEEGQVDLYDAIEGIVVVAVVSPGDEEGRALLVDEGGVVGGLDALGQGSRGGPRVGGRVVDVDLGDHLVGHRPSSHQNQLPVRLDGGVTVPFPRHLGQPLPSSVPVLSHPAVPLGPLRIERPHLVGQSIAREIIHLSGGRVDERVSLGMIASSRDHDLRFASVARRTYGGEDRGGMIREGGRHAGGMDLPFGGHSSVGMIIVIVIVRRRRVGEGRMAGEAKEAQRGEEEEGMGRVADHGGWCWCWCWREGGFCR
mmetsp:Transcript_50338/g.151599  ORF Transcript_50338/g.151599 Transcript_50338/m.151599 type:complete len:296 (-) Transcript_50338:252-1139(-)